MTKERNLPKLLRDAERRVNAHVFKRGGDDTLASIPANLDRDVDLLLMEAADAIERLERERDQALAISLKVAAERGTGEPPAGDVFDRYPPQTILQKGADGIRRALLTDGSVEVIAPNRGGSTT